MAVRTTDGNVSALRKRRLGEDKHPEGEGAGPAELNKQVRRGPLLRNTCCVFQWKQYKIHHVSALFPCRPDKPRLQVGNGCGRCSRRPMEAGRGERRRRRGWVTSVLPLSTRGVLTRRYRPMRITGRDVFEQRERNSIHCTIFPRRITPADFISMVKVCRGGSASS